MTVIEQLKEFLESKEKNRWLGDEYLAVYVRKSKRYINDRVTIRKTLNALDIASAEVPEEFQRQGMFTKFLVAAEEMNPYECIFLENVLNEVLFPLIDRLGYIQHPTLPSCYYKEKASVSN